MIKILIADDEPDILEFLKYNLEANGFIVFTAEDGKQAIEMATKERPDVIILDIMMPNMDGIEVCRELRERTEFNDTIIIFLTARSEDYSHIAGFEAGADDYIVKPVRLKVFIAKIQSIIRKRSQNTEKFKRKYLGDLIIDYEQRLLFKNGQEFQFPKKEFKIINILTSKPGKVFTREEIYSLIWGNDICVSERTLDVHIRKIREKIGDNYITTVKGIGYKFHIDNEL